MVDVLPPDVRNVSTSNVISVRIGERASKEEREL